MMGRPLTALWAVTRKVPAPGGASFLVSHLMRHWPVSILKESVWVSPWPDQEPMGRHPTRGCLVFGTGAERQPQLSAAAMVMMIKHVERALACNGCFSTRVEAEAEASVAG